MTGQSEIRVLIGSMMLAGNNVFNMKRDEIVILVDAAILATVCRTNVYT